jgi:integrase
VVRQHIARPGRHAPIGRCALADLTADVVAAWSAANERVLDKTTASIALLTLRSVCRFAVRRGWLSDNPVGLLEPAEKPRWRPGRVAVLEGDDLARVLDHAGSYRPLFELLAYTRLRIAKRWAWCGATSINADGVLRVHRQLTRYREHGPLKTEAGLPRGRTGSGHKQAPPGPLAGLALQGSRRPNVLYVGRPTAQLPQGRRHLPKGGASVGRPKGRSAVPPLPPPRVCLAAHRERARRLVYVSRQMGHANPAVTLSVYAHLFARREHAERAKAVLDASYGAMTSRNRSARS